MAITEANRLEMYLELRKVLGDEKANTLMEHLPPVGWANVARQDDMVARSDAMDRRFDVMDRRFDAMDRRFDAMDKKLNALTAIFATIGVGVIALQVEVILQLIKVK